MDSGGHGEVHFMVSAQRPAAVDNVHTQENVCAIGQHRKTAGSTASVVISRLEWNLAPSIHVQVNS